MRQPTEKEKIYMAQNICPKCRVTVNRVDMTHTEISYQCSDCGFVWSEYSNGKTIVWA